MGSKMDIFSKVSDDKMLKIYHDMLESNMIGSKSTMIRAYAKELASVYPFETNAQAIDLAEKLFFEETAKRFYPMRRKTPCFSYGDIRRVHRIYASN